MLGAVQVQALDGGIPLDAGVMRLEGELHAHGAPAKFCHSNVLQIWYRPGGLIRSMTFFDHIPGGADALGWWIALALLAILVAVWLRARLRRWWGRSRPAQAPGAGGEGREVAAAQLLEKQGYEIVESQARRQWELDVDGDLLEITVIADYLVEKDGESFVAEVKSGEQAPDLTNSATRRQLLEYALAYDSPTIILVDMARRRSAPRSYRPRQTRLIARLRLDRLRWPH